MLAVATRIRGDRAIGCRGIASHGAAEEGAEGVTSVARPERGTRPSNRRELIGAAAAELFCTRGYEHVGMGDIAEAVAVGPSALYRHFAGKQELLDFVVAGCLDSATALVDSVDVEDFDLSPLRAAEVAVSNRYTGILLGREARHLAAGAQARLRVAVRHLIGRIAALLAVRQPDLDKDAADLMAWSVVGIVLSPAFSQSDLSDKEQARLLAQLIGGILTAEAPVSYTIERRRRERTGLLPRSRREALLQEAIRLFAERRYASVGIEDVAASLGMAGPSVYNHFDTKMDLLVTALNRGAAYLYMQASDGLAVSDSAQDALSGLVASYVDFALTHPALVDLLVTEVRNLPEPHRDAALTAQRDYIEEWVHLLRQCHPDRARSAARLQVQAVLSLVNLVARVPHLQATRATAGAVAEMGRHLLAVPPASSA